MSVGPLEVKPRETPNHKEDHISATACNSNIYHKPSLVGGIPTPLKNDGVRQLGWLFPIYGNMEGMFQTTNQQLTP